MNIIRCAMLVLIAHVALQGYAQQSSVAAGGNATGSGGKVSFSAGQVVYTTLVGSTGTVAQGVQQPYEISVVSGIRNHVFSEISLTAYPNPAVDQLTLRIENFKNEQIRYQLMDMQGKVLDGGAISGSETQLNMGYLPAAVYFLNILDTNDKIRSFKIVKNQ